MWVHSGVILSGIYSRIFTRIDSLFRAGACTLWFLTFWLAYTDGCCANTMLRPLRGMWRFDSTRLAISVQYIANYTNLLYQYTYFGHLPITKYWWNGAFSLFQNLKNQLCIFLNDIKYIFKLLQCMRCIGFYKGACETSKIQILFKSNNF